MAGQSEVQRVIWGIMEVLLSYLTEQRMEYYILGGTLLGAVRHEGFIPWDDDMDIGLPRSQYERFLREIGTVLPPHLRLETYWDDSPHQYYFSRVVDLRYGVIRQGSLVPRREQVWVDIFPLDGMPDFAPVRWVHMLRLLYHRTLYHLASFDTVNLRRPDRPWTERLVIWLALGTGLGRGLDARKQLDQLDRLLRRYPVEGSSWICNAMGQYKFRELFPRERYGQGRLYPFEGRMLMGPVDGDFVLRRLYGDYWQFPPPEKRNVHQAEPTEDWPRTGD